MSHEFPYYMWSSIRCQRFWTKCRLSLFSFLKSLLEQSSSRMQPWLNRTLPFAYARFDALGCPQDVFSTQHTLSTAGYLVALWCSSISRKRLLALSGPNFVALFLVVDWLQPSLSADLIQCQDSCSTSRRFPSPCSESQQGAMSAWGFLYHPIWRRLFVIDRFQC